MGVEHSFGRNAIHVIYHSNDPDEDDVQEYELPETYDVDNTYVLKADEDYPEPVVKHLRDSVDANLVGYGGGDTRATEAEIRRRNPAMPEKTETTYYLSEKPPRMAVPIDEEEQLREAKEALIDAGLSVDHIECAYYYPVQEEIEVWYMRYETSADGVEARRVSDSERAVPAYLSTADERSIWETREQLREEHDDLDEALNEKDMPIVEKVLLADDPDNLEVTDDTNEDGNEEDPDPDPVLEKRQRVNEHDGAYYPDKPVDEQIDDEDEDDDGYPDAGGKPDSE